MTPEQLPTYLYPLKPREPNVWLGLLNHPSWPSLLRTEVADTLLPHPPCDVPQRSDLKELTDQLYDQATALTAAHRDRVDRFILEGLAATGLTLEEFAERYELEDEVSGFEVRGDGSMHVEHRIKVRPRETEA